MVGLKDTRKEEEVMSKYRNRKRENEVIEITTTRIIAMNTISFNAITATTTTNKNNNNPMFIKRDHCYYHHYIIKQQSSNVCKKRVNRIKTMTAKQLGRTNRQELAQVTVIILFKIGLGRKGRS